jgi:hypothetical protein
MVESGGLINPLIKPEESDQNPVKTSEKPVRKE